MRVSFFHNAKKEHFHLFFAVLVIAVLVALSVLQPFGVPRTEATGFDTGYAYRKSITIDLTRVPDSEASYTNFPILISFTDADFIQDADCLAGSPVVNGPCNVSGYDIVFTDSDGTTQLAHEKEVYDGSPGQGRVVMWVRIPTLPSTGANKVIYVYYGNNAISTFQGNITSNGVTGVWDANYMAVWHLSEISPNPHIDSSASPVTQSSIIVGAQGTATGIAGGADNFTAANNAVVFGDSPKWDATQFRTLEAWFNGTNGASWQSVVSRLTAANDWDYALLAGNATGIPNCYHATNQTNNTLTDIVPSTWTYLACAMGGSSTLYMDGISRGTGAAALVVDNTTQPLVIGNAFTNNESPIGIIDEVRVSNIVRTPGWLETTYNTIRYPGPGAPDPLDFYGVGIEEAGNAPPTVPTLDDTPAFANWYTNNTTAVLGTFSSTDTDPIEYEIQWATDVGFTTGVVVKNSANFAAIDNGFDQATFASGVPVSYTPTGQPGDIFVNNTTYWWRVRARDPAGSNSFSQNSAVRSFTINTSLPADAWFQTTSDQFLTAPNAPTDIDPAPGGVKVKGW